MSNLRMIKNQILNMLPETHEDDLRELNDMLVAEMKRRNAIKRADASQGMRVGSEVVIAIDRSSKHSYLNGMRCIIEKMNTKTISVVAKGDPNRRMRVSHAWLKLA